MKKHFTSSMIALALSLPLAATAADYAVQPAQSKLGFSSSFQGSAFSGSFGKWTAVISYDPSNLSTSKFDVQVDLASAKTGDNDRDKSLPGADFFNVAKFPQAHFVTTGFRKNGTQVIADGNLSLRGVTKPVSLVVNFTPAGKNASLDVAGSIKRLDFGVGAGEYADTSVIAADVKVSAHLVLAPK